MNGSFTVPVPTGFLKAPAVGWERGWALSTLAPAPLLGRRRGAGPDFTFISGEAGSFPSPFEPLRIDPAPPAFSTTPAMFVYPRMTPDDEAVLHCFRALGYRVEWDADVAAGQRWWEVYADNVLVAEVDLGVPLSALREDFRGFLAGRRAGTSGFACKVGGRDTPALFEFFQKVVEYPA